MGFTKSVTAISSLSFTLMISACASQAGYAPNGPFSSLASKANISDHAQHGHASSYYICEEQDLNIIYDQDVPAIQFQGLDLPITRVQNDFAEQYAAIMQGQDVLLTILDHAATLQIGDKTYKTCDKLACVPLDAPR